MRLITITFLSFACAAAQAQVYKWTDKDGNVHYGDKPKHAAQQVELRTTGGEPGEDSKLSAAQAAECDRLRSQYETYSKATTIKETDNLGRTKDYTPEERQIFLEKVAKQREAACNPPPAAE